VPPDDELRANRMSLGGSERRSRSSGDLSDAGVETSCRRGDGPLRPAERALIQRRRPEGGVMDLDDGAWRLAFESVFLGRCGWPARSGASPHTRRPRSHDAVHLGARTDRWAWRCPTACARPGDGREEPGDERGGRNVRVNGVCRPFDTERTRTLDARRPPQETLRAHETKDTTGALR
jgi:hypothetical protein